MTKRVALIGSSGGGTATLGHTDPVSFLQTVHEQLSLGGARLVVALFVALDGGKGMDGIDQRHPARLFEVDGTGDTLRFEVVALGPLAQVNQHCQERQKTLIVQAVKEKRVDALICVSCHVEIFRETLQAAASRPSFPVTGSGGTSLAQVGSAYGIHLQGNAGGSVATTSLTKAVSYTFALTNFWRQAYQPWKDSPTSSGPSWTSVLNSCLPAFWGVCLTKKALSAVHQFLNVPDNSVEHWSVARNIGDTIMALEHYTLPTVCAIMMALSLRQKDALSSESSLVMAAAVASSSCYDSIMAGLLAGYLVALWSDRLLCACIFRNIPATMTSILIGGGLGGVVSVLLLLVSEVLRKSTSMMRYALASVILSQPWGVGVAFVLGCLSCYGSKVGWYHSVHLPLILIEMELGEASFLGAIDELTLVLVCAGVCAAVQISSKKKEEEYSPADILLCRRGFWVNMSCGDFVEVCYPYMEKSPLVNGAGYLASGLACAWLVWRREQPDDVILPQSMAYLPWPLAVVLASKESVAMFEASLVALVVTFVTTLTLSKRGCILEGRVLEHK